MDYRKQSATAADRVNELLSVRDRATKRLESFNPTGAFAAIAGIKIDASDLPLGDRFVLRQLAERPQIYGSELTRSLPVTHELHFDVPAGVATEDWVTGAIWTVVALMRASCNGFFIVTEIGDRSWEVVDALGRGQVRTRPLNVSVPPWFGRSAPAELSSDGAEWIARRWFDVLDLRKDRVAHFMLESLETSFSELDQRMAVTKVWAGIEAFLGASTEIRFRLSTLIAAALEAPGDSRFTLYKKLQKLYDTRSRVVHGSAVDITKVESHLFEARSILTLLVRLVVDGGSVPTIVDLERLLLDPAVD
jgi:hypothetical protein